VKVAGLVAEFVQLDQMIADCLKTESDLYKVTEGPIQPLVGKILDQARGTLIVSLTKAITESYPRNEPAHRSPPERGGRGSSA
jgi:hypothetical protein